MNYWIIDKKNDFKIFAGKITGEDKLIITSALGLTGVPKLWSPKKIILVQELFINDSIKNQTERKVNDVWAIIVEQFNLPHYLIKRTLDTFYEKICILEAIASISGTKYYVSCGSVVISLDGDNLESERLLAFVIEGTPRFKAVKTEWGINNRTCRNLGRLGYQLMRSIFLGKCSNRFNNADVVLLNNGYGVRQAFQSQRHCLVNGGVLLHLAIEALDVELIYSIIKLQLGIKQSRNKSSVNAKLFNLLQVMVDKCERLSDLIYPIIKEHSASIQYLFSTGHSSLINKSLVNSFHKLNIKIVSMQHALVGHDEWTASQYIDLWGVDLKCVVNENVKKQLEAFEVKKHSRGQYIVARIPHLLKSRKAVYIDTTVLRFIATGVVCNNIMYDNRRVNDLEYVCGIINVISYLVPRYKTIFRSHPYDAHQNNSLIPRYISETTGAELELPNGPIVNNGALNILDSPSTIILDLVLAGAPIFIINVTAKLRQEFLELATRCWVLFRCVEDLVQYIRFTPQTEVKANQEKFAFEFYSKYIETDNTEDILSTIKVNL